MTKLAYVLGILLIAGFAALGVAEMRKSATPYVETVAAVRASKADSVQFMGEVVPDTSGYDEKTDELRFELKDENGDVLRVSYDGVKPANFDSADHLVVSGSLRGRTFVASEVITKCPSKYEGR